MLVAMFTDDLHFSFLQQLRSTSDHVCRAGFRQSGPVLEGVVYFKFLVCADFRKLANFQGSSSSLHYFSLID